MSNKEMSNEEMRSESSHYNNLSYLRNLRDLRDKKLSVSIRVNPWSVQFLVFGKFVLFV